MRSLLIATYLFLTLSLVNVFSSNVLAQFGKEAPSIPVVAGVRVLLMTDSGNMVIRL